MTDNDRTDCQVRDGPPNHDPPSRPAAALKLPPPPLRKSHGHRHGAAQQGAPAPLSPVIDTGLNVWTLASVLTARDG
ncbi:hypothetical protein ACIGXQ_37840 [Streptomyces anulatus]